MSSACSKPGLLIATITLLSQLNTFGQPNMKNDGYNKLLYPNGKVASEGFTKDGKPDGFWKNYYESGAIKSSGNRKDMLLDGIWKFYNEDSTLSTEISYQADKRNGYTWKYEAGKLTEKVFYVENKKQGEGLSFYETGEMKTRVTYLDDLKDGEGFEYDKDGRIIALLKFNKDLMVSRDEINRFNKDKQKQGKWVEFHENGINKLVGPYTEGKKNGIFKEYDKKGKLIAIYKYDEDQLAESSKDVDVLEEKKTYYQSAKVKTSATYRDGKLQGFLKEFDENGKLINSSKYDQDVKLAEGIIDSLAREQGLWKYFYETGELKAEGKYLDGKKIEEWKYYFRNGQLEQTGFYKKDIVNGKWMWYHENGKIHREELFKNGLQEGQATEYDRLGYMVSNGKYVEGKRIGDWFYYVGDHLEEGKYRDGNRDGVWHGYYDEEKKEKEFEGAYKDGAEDGIHTYYYPNGLVKEIREYKVGVKTGKWQFNNEDGTPYVTSDYKNNEVIKINGVPVKDKEKKEKKSGAGKTT